MKQFFNHHGGETTTFIGDFCINRCQTFMLAQAADVFAKYGVSLEHQADVLANLPQSDWSFDGCGSDVRHALAKNTNTPVEMLKLLAKDDDWCVRCAVAGNSNTPDQALELLVKDGDWCVSRASQNNLKTR